MMKVIGAGFGRTGTLSMKAALGKLLGGPCYHMESILRSETQLGYWTEWAREPTREPDWDRILDGYVAGVDAPICFYWEQLMARYPEAKVLLTVRDPKRWYASHRNLIMTAIKLSWMGLLSGRIRKFGGFVRTMGRHFLPTLDESKAIAAFERHNARVQQIVPPERLLVMEVKQGWPPLCEFLGVPIPDEPFPHLNEGVETIRKGHWDLLLRRTPPEPLLR
ncbi:MAG: sulfotransferase family protein [Myxococcales bacterium]|nr:sulfotransferase family protein [Myxococcales bacterium]